MIRTQIQLSDKLYRGLRRLAKAQEVSLAEVIRRASERELLAHPEIQAMEQAWHLPEPRALGIREEVPVDDWRLLANEGDPANREGE